MKIKDNAVSPIIAVMLMLVVTIIIAAVVSGFAGGLVGGSTSKAPTLSMDMKVVNAGNTANSGFTATVTGVSEPIATKNLKIVTQWKTKNKNTGFQVIGGATSTGGSLSAPWGFGPGVTGQTADNQFSNLNSKFGNYTLQSGTGLLANNSSMTSVLGTGWDNLTTGDAVTVSVVHIPTAKVIFQKDVSVIEG
jgi:archaeal type IV pilus assembly protein PilA